MKKIITIFAAAAMLESVTVPVSSAMAFTASMAGLSVRAVMNL